MPGWPRATLALLAAMGAFGLASCGNESDGTFERDGYPFTFEYPSGLELTEDVSLAQELGGGAEETLALALDDDDAILLQRFTLLREIEQSNLELVKREIDGLLAQIDPDAASAKPGEIAGFPSLEYDGVSLSTPEEGESRITFLFEGDQEYVINCQSTPDGREEIDAACDQVLETLEPAG